MSQHIFSNVRVQILQNNVVRLEQIYGKDFCDQNTYFVPDRSVFAGFDSIASVDADGNNVVEFGNYKLVVPANPTNLDNIQLFHNGKLVYKYKSIANSGELPVPHKTPAVFPIADKPRVIVPEVGYAKGARYAVHKKVNDVYLLLCEGNFALLRQLYVQLTGKTEMVRLATLGLWNSRYFEHSDASARELLKDYAKHDVPLDVMVLDTDWRLASDRGIGYDVNTTLFPSMRKFFSFAHKNNVEVMFNDHPEPVEGAKSLLSPKEISYRVRNLTRHMKSGLDYWWYDRNWHTKLISPVSGIEPESFGAYLFADVTKNYFQSVGSKEIYRRPVIMCNADNIANGNYVAINDSASHRYSIQWTGDVPSDDASIATEIKNMLLAQNNCLTYLHPDCGGHTGNPTKQEYIRWMQLGAFSPVFRPHCTKEVVRFREPWVFDNQALNISREFIKMRYRLMPVWYKSAYESHNTGLPLIRPLEFAFPQDKRTYANSDQFMLGDNIMVAPMHGVAPLRVPQNCYCSSVDAVYFDGTEFAGEPIYKTTYNVLQNYYKHTSPAPQVPVYNHSAKFKTLLCFPQDVELIVEADDGVTVTVDGVVTLKDDSFHSACKMKAGVLSANVIHSVQIDYFQGGGEASIALFYNPVKAPCSLTSRSVYLPEGNWIDVFSGKEMSGGTYKVSCDYDVMPLYVQKGAVIPLLNCAQTTADQDWSNITLDWYPSTERNVCDYLYEDDGQTTAYKLGQVRKTCFATNFDADSNTMQLTVGASKGDYHDDMTTRKVNVKYHLLKGTSKVLKVLVNGTQVDFAINEIDKNVYPFATTTADCGTQVLSFAFDKKLDEETLVQVVLK